MKILVLGFYFLSICSAKPTIWEFLTTDERFVQLIHAIEVNNLTSVYKQLDAETVFAATNEAFSSKVSKEQLLYHIINISALTKDLWDGRILSTHATIDTIPQRLKIHAKDHGTISISTGIKQVKIAERDIVVDNGVVHVMDALLPLPDYLDTSLSSLESTQPFYHACDVANIVPDLAIAKHYTVFVPQGDLFGDTLTRYEQDYLLKHPEGQEDLRMLLQRQIATKLFFSTDFEEGNSTIDTVEGTPLALHTTASNITVNGVAVVKTDIIAANGVIHLLEKPLMPVLERTPRKVMLGWNATQFLDSIDRAGLSKDMDNCTLLVPPNEPPPRKHHDAWLKYHVVHGRFYPDQVERHTLLETESHDALGSLFQSIDVHRKGNTLQFGRSLVLEEPVSIENRVVLYRLQHALRLPRSILHALRSRIDLSTFLASVYASGHDDTLHDAQGISLFAPSNDAFESLGLLGKHLLRTTDDLAQVVLFHAVQDVFYEQKLETGKYMTHTLTNDSCTLNKTQDELYFNQVRVSQSDALMANGVLHTVDRVQMPPSLNVSNRDLMMVDTSTLRMLHEIEDSDDISDEVLTGDTPYVVLAPQDIAFGEKKNVQVKLHILPSQMPNFGEGFVSDMFPTLTDAKVQIFKGASGYRVHVQDGTSASVLQTGRNTAGGGVIIIDRILEHSVQSTAWYDVFWIALGTLVSLIILGALGWAYYHREGQLRLSDTRD